MTKIDVAKEVLSGIVDLLHPEDHFGIVLFTDGTCEPKRLGPVSCANITEIQEGIWVSTFFNVTA
jgi:hypothetical protein